MYPSISDVCQTRLNFLFRPVIHISCRFSFYFPSKINCSEAELSKVFAAAVNQNINIAFSDNFLIDGTVTGNIIKYNNLQTVVIKLPLFADAIFVLSKITNTDNSIIYVGRIINKKYFDGYELKKDNHNNYQLIKIETDKVMQDCSHS